MQVKQLDAALTPLASAGTATRTCDAGADTEEAARQAAAALVRLALQQHACNVPCHATLAALARLSKQQTQLLGPHSVVLGFLAASCGEAAVLQACADISVRSCFGVKLMSRWQSACIPVYYSRP